jgi:hypothetical protein
MRPRRRSLKGRLSAAATLLALVGGALVIAGPARAEPFPFTDGFETPSRWVTGQVSGMSSVQIVRDSRARNNTNNIAILHAFPRNPALASVFRTVTPDDLTPRPGRRCTPSVYLRRVANSGEVEHWVNVLLRVRQRGTTGRIISSRFVSYISTDVWTSVNFNAFPWPADTFTIEVSSFLGTVLVDDLSFTCS